MNKLLSLFSLLGLLAWSGCRCDDPTDPACPNYCVDETNPECPNYDPCWDQTEVSAEFRIIENGSYGPLQLYDTMYFDTFYVGALITEAIHQHDDWTYRWIIGAGEYEGKSTALDYRSANYGAPVQMTLIVEGPPNTACFPGDDGRDTVTRVVYRGRHLTTGMYHGYLNGNKEDTVTLGFNSYQVPGDSRTYVDMVNFYPGCSSSLRVGAATTRKRRFASGGSIECASPRGLLVLDPGKSGDFDSVRIDYSIRDDSTPDPDDLLNFVFQGRRR